MHCALHDKGVDRVRQAHRLIGGVDPLCEVGAAETVPMPNSEADRGSGKQQGRKRLVSMHRSPPPLRSGRGPERFEPVYNNM